MYMSIYIYVCIYIYIYLGLFVFVFFILLSLSAYVSCVLKLNNCFIDIDKRYKYSRLNSGLI